MKPRLNLTPTQLILIGVAGFVISVAALSLTRFVRTSDACDCILWTRVLLILSPFVVGLVAILTASSSLKQGIKNQQWPAEQIDPLRSWLESPYSTALSMILVLSYAALSFPHSRLRGVGLAAFLLAMLLTQLRSAVRRPRVESSDALPKWHNLAPIHSDHWGQR